MKCNFYDDGCGNGGYCSGMNAGPPGCSFPKNKLKSYPKCNGQFDKCDNNTGPEAKKRTFEIIQLENLIKKRKM